MHFKRHHSGLPCVLILLFLACVGASPASAGRHSNKPLPDASEIARTALAPYLAAHTYRGTRTTTVVSGKDRTEVTYSVSIKARCNDEGTVDRYRIQTLCWGRQQGKDLDDSQNTTSVMDGKTLWTMRPSLDHYRRATPEQTHLLALLELPPPGLAWRLMTRKHDDSLDERALHATQGKTDWTLVTDTTSGRLLRVETEDDARGPHTVSVTVLRDIAFDADLPESAFAFTPPAWMSEDRPSVAEAAP